MARHRCRQCRLFQRSDSIQWSYLTNSTGTPAFYGPRLGPGQPETGNGQSRKGQMPVTGAAPARLRW